MSESETSNLRNFKHVIMHYFTTSIMNIFIVHKQIEFHNDFDNDLLCKVNGINVFEVELSYGWLFAESAL